MKTTKETINILIEFEYLIRQLLGSKYKTQSIAKNAPLNEYKVYLSKIINHLQKTIKLNITSDAKHYKDLNHEIDFLKKEINEKTSVDEINILFIVHIIKTIYHLIGVMPDNQKHIVINNSSHYKLEEFRKINYTQNNEQKANLIRYHINNSPELCNKIKFPNSNNTKIDDFFYNDCKSDSLEFIRWVKKNYPDIYLDIF